MTEDRHRKAWSSRGNPAVDLVEDYRQELMPLIVPLTLLKHQLDRCSLTEWVDEQVFLHPYPKELMLWNHV
jgi:uncharacterized protein YbgA (DUF1722 family)